MRYMSISIIIPAYNAENTIERCLNSVLAQVDIQNIKEVLVVDDGSKDRTAEIVRNYEIDFSIVRLIEKVNGGVSSARNAGIRSATGDYIIFCDSDDEMKPEMSKRLFDAIEASNADVGICGYEEKSLQNCRLVCPRFLGAARSVSIRECFDEMFYGFFLNQPWNKIFKKCCIDEFFDESMQNGEDIKFVLAYLTKHPNCVILPEALYCVHTENDNSLSRQRLNAITTTTTVQLILWSFINKMYINTSISKFSDYCISLLWAPAVDGILLNQFSAEMAASSIVINDGYVDFIRHLRPTGLVNILVRLTCLCQKQKILVAEFKLLVLCKRLRRIIQKY